MVLFLSTRICTRRLPQNIFPTLKSTAVRRANTFARQKTALPQRSAGPPRPTKRSDTLAGGFTIQELQQHANALKLYENGITRLYSAPRDTSFIAGSWFIAGLCFASSFTIYQLGHWRADDPYKLHWLVSWTHRLVMPVMGWLGCWLILRTSRRISTIDLVSRGGSNISLKIVTRRPFPLWPKQQFSKELTDFVLDKRVIVVPEMPAWVDTPPASSKKPGLGTNIGKRVSVAFYSFFVGTRKIFSGQGLLDVEIRGMGRYKMDLSGDYHDAGRSLLSVASIER